VLLLKALALVVVCPATGILVGLGTLPAVLHGGGGAIWTCEYCVLLRCLCICVTCNPDHCKCLQVEQGTKDLSSIRKENVLLRNIVQDQQKALLTAVVQQQDPGEIQDTQDPDQQQQQQQQNDAAAGMPIGTAKQLQQLQELYQAQIRLDEEQQAATAAAAAAAAAAVAAAAAGRVAAVAPAVPAQQWMLC
jgi:hypothetical protein